MKREFKFFFLAILGIHCAIIETGQPSSRLHRLKRLIDAQTSEKYHNSIIQFSLYHEVSSKYISTCTGTFILDRESFDTILTAAHCWNSSMEISQAKVSITTKDHSIEPLDVAHVHIHPLWNGIDHDIALIVLKDHVPFSLPLEIIRGAHLNCSTKLLQYGFGLEEVEPDWVLSEQLKLTESVLFECLYPEKLQPVTSALQTINSTLLTFTHENICKGDSGGPLLNANTDEILGIVYKSSPIASLLEIESSGICEKSINSVNQIHADSIIDWLEQFVLIREPQGQVLEVIGIAEPEPKPTKPTLPSACNANFTYLILAIVLLLTIVCSILFYLWCSDNLIVYFVPNDQIESF